MKHSARPRRRHSTSPAAQRHAITVAEEIEEARRIAAEERRDLELYDIERCMECDKCGIRTTSFNDCCSCDTLGHIARRAKRTIYNA